MNEDQKNLNSLEPVQGLYAFHLPEIISTVLGKIENGGQHGMVPKPESCSK